MRDHRLHRPGGADAQRRALDDQRRAVVDCGDGATNYRLLRRTTTIYQGASLSFATPACSEHAQYCYTVMAGSSCGESVPSNQRCVTTGCVAVGANAHRHGIGRQCGAVVDLREWCDRLPTVPRRRKVYEGTA